MPDEVEPLGARDFDEAMLLLNRVFGEGKAVDFPRMLASVYQPTEAAMRHNLGIRHRGRLVAILGQFPAFWHLGSAKLPIARIGGVAVARDARGQGLMRRLMEAARQRAREQGYALGFLGGQRSLYSRFGFERAGTELVFHLVRDDLIRRFGRGDSVVLEPLRAGLSSDLMALWEHEPLRCARTSVGFAAHLTAWLHEAMVARDPSGELVGYLTGQRTERRVTELVARTPALALAMVAQWTLGSEATVLTSPLPTALIAALHQVADRVEAAESGNWSVYDWPRVLGALLAARHEARPLPRGQAILGIQGEPRAVKLRLDDTGTHSTLTDEPPELTAPPGAWLRWLTGPAPNGCELVLDSPSVLEGWRPLPLWLSRQDHV